LKSQSAVKGENQMTQLFKLVFVFGMLGILATTTGCATKKTTKKVNAIEAQIGVITDELTRMDQSISELQAQQGQQVAFAPSGAANTAIYRTPSGFELPSANIQRALKNAGYYQGNVDGKVGPATKDAVKAFQSDNGLTSDGVVGRQTWEKLKAYLGGAAA
jgi:murein L,D-transpeptidase YcbB/YkuD